MAYTNAEILAADVNSFSKDEIITILMDLKVRSRAQTDRATAICLEAGPHDGGRNWGITKEALDELMAIGQFNREKDRIIYVLFTRLRELEGSVPGRYKELVG